MNEMKGKMMMNLPELTMLADFCGARLHHRLYELTMPQDMMMRYPNVGEMVMLFMEERIPRVACVQSVKTVPSPEGRGKMLTKIQLHEACKLGE